MTAARQSRENMVHLNSLKLKGRRDFAYGYMVNVQGEDWRKSSLPPTQRIRF